MEPTPNNPVSPQSPPQPTGSLSNDGSQRYLLEAESTTGFVAFQLADGIILISGALQVSLKSSPFVRFWSCASYANPAPAGQIIDFDCHGNALTSLDVRALTGLEYLDASFNQLRSLCLDGLTELQAIDVDNNLLTSIDVRGLRHLRVLNCANNRLAALDVSGLDLLQILDCSNNLISSFHRRGCTALQDAETDGNPFCKTHDDVS